MSSLGLQDVDQGFAIKLFSGVGHCLMQCLIVSLSLSLSLLHPATELAQVWLQANNCEARLP